MGRGDGRHDEGISILLLLLCIQSCYYHIMSFAAAASIINIIFYFRFLFSDKPYTSDKSFDAWMLGCSDAARRRNVRGGELEKE